MEKLTPVQKLRQREAEWMERATRSAIEAARAVTSDGAINGKAALNSLSDLEWGWLATAAIFAWIRTKSEQAVAEGIGYDHAIMAMPGHVPSPWDAGAVKSILPALAEIEGIDWDKPVGEWPQDQVIGFAWKCHQLIGTALGMRDLGAEDKLTREDERRYYDRDR